MLRTNDRESEILLGNKQLLGIFFAVALLLGVAFYGGYMVGRSSSAKKALDCPETAAAAAAIGSQSVSAGETHTIPGESGGSAEESHASASAGAGRQVEPGFSRTGGRR